MKRIIDWIRDETPINPARAVLHPAWIVAVTVLLVNDHILKAADAAPLLAGKLSDFAGLFFAPVLLAALIGVKRRRGLVASAAAVGGVFALINVSPAAAAVWDSTLSMVTPWYTTPDPGDLIALLAIPVGLAVLEPTMHRRRAGHSRRLMELAAVTVGGLASMATTGPCPGGDCSVEVTESSQVSILNKSHELHVLRVRFPRGEIDVDCDEVEKDPNRFLQDDIFGAPVSWLIQSGQEIPVRADFRTTDERSCRMALVQSDTLPDILIFWDDSLPMKTYPFDADIPREIPADPQTVVIDADYENVDPADMHEWRERSDCGSRADLCSDEEIAPLADIPPGARYSWRSQTAEDEEPLHYVRPAVQEGTLDQPPEQCRMPGAESGLAWENPPLGDQFVTDITRGEDGCHELQLVNSLDATEPQVEGWWLCAPWGPVSEMMSEGDGFTRIAVGRDTRSATLLKGGYEGLRIDVTRLDSEQNFQDFFTLYATRGYGVPDSVDFGFGIAVREGCDPVDVACGQVALPVDVQIQDFNTSVRPGQSVTVGDVLETDIHVVRADYRPVLDLGCEVELPAMTYLPQGAEGRVGYLETVMISRQ